uniref:F-box/LRR-repeat protein 15-like leucin rich repeat domain-containing protein n=1 Tax=Strigamia maritima TaxID=126957 RepID=T1IJ86_STRMM
MKKENAFSSRTGQPATSTCHFLGENLIKSEEECTVKDNIHFNSSQSYNDQMTMQEKEKSDNSLRKIKDVFSPNLSYWTYLLTTLSNLWTFENLKILPFLKICNGYCRHTIYLFSMLYLLTGRMQQLTDTVCKHWRDVNAENPEINNMQSMTFHSQTTTVNCLIWTESSLFRNREFRIVRFSFRLAGNYRLDKANPKIAPEHLHLLSERCKQLKQLNLKRRQFTDEGVLGKWRSRLVYSNAFTLSVNKTTIEDKSLFALQNVISLKNLSVAATKVTDVGLFVLSQKGLLEKLVVSYCSQIGDPGCISVIRNCKNLKKFDVSYCSKVTDAIVHSAEQERTLNRGKLVVFGSNTNIQKAIKTSIFEVHI